MRRRLSFPLRVAITRPSLPAVATVLLLVAVVAGTFFDGTNGDTLIASQTLLLLSVAIVVWRGYSRSWIIPLTGLTATVTLYWMWLAVTISWSRAPYYSVYLFWWMGSLPLGFWWQTLAVPQWRGEQTTLATAVVLLAVALAVAGIIEVYAFGTGPQVMFLNKNSFAGLLNLIALPAAACLALRLANRNQQRDYLSWAMTGAVFLLVFASGLTQGRGPLVSLVFAGLILVASLFRHLPKRALWITAAVVVSAIVLSHFFHGGALGRFGAVSDSQGSVWQRWLIWRSAWDLLADSPWWGTGLGVFALAWQHYRDPNDVSGGFLAHNDYLQLWIEAGVPGLVLFVSMLAAATWAFLRVLKLAKDRTAVRVEAAGYYSGIVAVSTHSLVDFNFYVVPILILCGLMLSRIQGLRAALEPVRACVVKPSRRLTPLGYRTITVLVLVFPLVYFLALAMSSYETRRGVDYAEKGQLELAEQSLMRAARYNPASDAILMTQADLYRHAITTLPAGSASRRTELFQLARGLLEEAIRLNSLRVQTYLVRANLYLQNAALLGAGGDALTREAFGQAIALNPRALDARFAYARYLIACGSVDTAKEILETGLRYVRIRHPGLVPYYSLSAKLRRDAGDTSGAEALEANISELQSRPVSVSQIP